MLVIKDESDLDIKPKFVTVVKVCVSETCFFRCKTCSIWENTKKDSFLDKKVYSHFFQCLKKISDKNTSVNFTGGEPLSSPIIFDLLKMARKSGIRTSLNTNGWLLTDRTIEKLCDASLGDIMISLDGSTKELHDSIRGMRGSYERIMAAIPEIRRCFEKGRKKIQIIVLCVISKRNIDDILTMARMIQKNKDIDYINFNAIASPLSSVHIHEDRIIKSGEPWYRSAQFSNLWPDDRDKRLNVISNLILMRKKGYKISNSVERLRMIYQYFANPSLRQGNVTCSVFSDLNIGMNGDVTFCNIKNEVIGNIKTGAINEIWGSKLSDPFRREIVLCKRNCHELLNCGQF